MTDMLHNKIVKSIPMQNNIVSRAKVGARLRAEREKRALNQEDFGKIAGVTRNSQAAYEAGKSPCNIDYIEALETHGIDVRYVLTGERDAADLPPEAFVFANLATVLSSGEVTALLYLASALVHRAGGKAGEPLMPQPTQLPAEEALERAFLGVLAASRRMDEAELARELAKNLPTMLEVLRPPLTVERGTDEVPADHANADPARQRA